MTFHEQATLSTEVVGNEIRAFDVARPARDLWVRSSSRGEFLHQLEVARLGERFSEVQLQMLRDSLDNTEGFREGDLPPTRIKHHTLAYAGE